MIVVRDIFQVDPPSMKKAKDEWTKGREICDRHGYPTKRVLTTVTGPAYALVVESEFESLGAFENAMETLFASEEWAAWYPEFRGLINGARREVLGSVD